MPTWSYGDEFVRGLWDLDPHVAFLNHGSYGAVPRAVQTRHFEIQAEIEKNPVKFLSRDLPEKLSVVREDMARWLRTDPEGLAFVPNATSGVGAVLTSLRFQPGDEIVFHNHGYGWVRQGLNQLSAQAGVVIREADIPVVPRDATQVAQAFADVITKKTKLLICDHVTSPSALIFPVQAIVRLAHDAGIPVLVDGAHAPGFLPLDLSKIDADFYTGNFHKWLCAPRGCAFLSVAPQWRHVIRPQSLSYCGGVTHHRLDQSLTGFFDWTGTNHFASWLTLPSALEFHNQLEWPRVFFERHSLLLEGYSLLLKSQKLDTESLPAQSFWGAMATVPWKAKGQVTPSYELARTLTKKIYEQSRIEVPVIFFKDSLFVRISAQIYNTLAEMQRLAEALKSDF